MKNILVAEDDAIIAWDIKLKLSAHGYNVIATAATANKCIELANNLSPDVIIMDVGLAGSVTGIEAAKAINRNKSIPVIFLTGAYIKEIVKNMPEIDLDCVLSKPVDDILLFKKLDEILAN